MDEWDGLTDGRTHVDGSRACKRIPGEMHSGSRTRACEIVRSEIIARVLTYTFCRS